MHAPHTGTDWDVLGVGGGRISICNCRGLPWAEGCPLEPQGQGRDEEGFREPSG